MSWFIKQSILNIFRHACPINGALQQKRVIITGQVYLNDAPIS